MELTAGEEGYKKQVPLPGSAPSLSIAQLLPRFSIPLDS